MKRYLAMVAASVCLSTIGIFVKLIGDTVPIMTVIFFRFLFGFILIAIAAPLLDRSFLKVKRRDVLKFALLGLLIVVDFSLYTAAYTMAPVSNIILVASTFPIFVAIFSYCVLREKTDKAGIVSFVLAFTGLLIINPFQPSYYAGSILALANAVLYGLMIVTMRYFDEHKRIGIVFWFMGFATLFTLPFPFVYGLGAIQSSLLWAVLLGMIPTGLAYLLFNFSLEKMPAEVSSLIMLTVEPVAAIGMALLIIGESLALNVIIGGILIVAGGLFLDIKDHLLNRY